MVDFLKMMGQVRDMQKNMERVKEDLAAREVEFSSPGGLVKAVAKGDGRLVSIKIDPRLAQPDDVAMLESMVLAACDGALQKARDMMAEEMGKLTAGLNIPGMNLPF